jgi:uroporphyrinogen III methyltransferase/synthase
MGIKGKVILVGAGPGDVGLITVRGLAAIAEAEVLIYDYLANVEFLNSAPPAAEKIYVGKKGGCHTLKQEQIQELLLEKARSGKKVVRLKGGDPYIFGRGSEEAEFLIGHDVEVEVIPGIPAAIGTAAFTGIPLTDRRHNTTVTFITGHEDPTKEKSTVAWESFAQGNGTLVFYMGIKNLAFNMQKLVEYGRPADTPVSIVEWGTTPQQRVVTGTVGTIAEIAKKEKVKPPALTIVGTVNNFYDTLAWFEKKPLFGKTLVVTRSRTQASKLIKPLQDQGARVIEMPTIKIIPPESWDGLDKSIQQLKSYGWIIFTSVNAVDAFFERLQAAGKDARSLSGISCAAVGPATAKQVRETGIIPDLVPTEYTAKKIFEELESQQSLKGTGILMPRSALAKPDLAELLVKAGARVDDVVGYQTVPSDFDAALVKEQIQAGQVSGITFTSSSTARFFTDRVGADFVKEATPKITAFSIGPETSKTIQECGMTVAAEAADHTIAGLTDLVISYFNQ